ncbi:MraY family glycosyltransferase [Marinihelvus fidelis]|nr:MraY family glycosyltransferase [Marinihelvus fidelis]
MSLQGENWPWVAAGITLLMAAALVPVARRAGWLDWPSGRKQHIEPTPLVGGPAIFGGLFATLALAGVGTAALPAACALIMVTGLVDDRWPLSASVRFGLQTMACLVMVFVADVYLADFGRLFMDRVLDLGLLAVPITVFAALGVINAFNMIDGVDGVSGSIFVLCCLSMALLAAVGGRADMLPSLLVSAGAVCGFLLLNARLPWNPVARVFLGDSGSLLLGLLLAWFFIDLGNGSRTGVERAFAPMTAVWIFGLPLLDTTRLMASRWRAGRSAFSADDRHLHHALAQSGLSVGQTWGVVVLLSAGFMVAGIAMEWFGVPECIRFYAFIATGVAYLRWMRVHMFKE